MRAATRICIVRGCNQSTTGTRCEAHEREWKLQRYQSDPRVSDPVWRKVRAAVKARDKVCQTCGRKQPYVRALEVHHKDGNRANHELRNLVLLCDGCHREADRALGIRR